ncbi:MAG: hypothetical protein GX491_10350 [Chloroflexi bacterium]|nr:hypothetical protein [Chloroflexota bacterium]
MAFALAVNNLMGAMKKPGCPICRISRQASEKALESFLWENVNEPDVRQGILDSYGFCAEHTRVMVSREVFTSSIPLGTNIIYEHLGRVVAKELKSQRPGSPARAAGQLGEVVRGWLKKAGLARLAGNGPLHPRGVCPACEQGQNGAMNSLHVLAEELQRAGEGSQDVREAYLSSDGLCLAHLRSAVELHSGKFPQAVRLLIDDAVQRLESQSKHMKEYIRKNNWTYRDEKLTEEEDTAWRHTLTFFTGLPGEAFNYRSDDY